MGSTNGNSKARDDGSGSSSRNDGLRFVDHYGGYTWNDEAHAWIYDGCNGVYPPSRHDPTPPVGQTFNHRQPISYDYGHYYTPDENGNFYASDEYGRWRSSSPEQSSAYQNPNMSTRQVESDGRPATSERLKPKRTSKKHWTFEEERLLVSLVREGRLPWAQISTRLKGRSEKACGRYWEGIKVSYPDVHYRYPTALYRHPTNSGGQSGTDTGSRRPSGRD